MTRLNRLLILLAILPFISGCYTEPQLPQGQAAFLKPGPAHAIFGPFRGYLRVHSIDGHRIVTSSDQIVLTPGKHKVQLKWESQPMSFSEVPSPGTFRSEGEVEFVAEAGKTYIAKVTETKVLVSGQHRPRARFWIEPEAP